MSGGEILDRPSDVIGNLLRTGVQHLMANTKTSAGTCLLGHGLVKIVLVAGLLRGLLGRAVLTVFDMGVIYLIWREYRVWKDVRRRSTEEA